MPIHIEHFIQNTVSNLADAVQPDGMMDIAIVSSFDAHYECLGSVLYWITTLPKGTRIGLFVKINDTSLEWLSIYKSIGLLSDMIKIRDIDKFKLSMIVGQFAYVIFPTATDDLIYPPTSEDLANNIIVITHGSQYTNKNAKHQLAYGPFQDLNIKYITGCFQVPQKLCISTEVKDAISNIKILMVGAIMEDDNFDALEELLRCPNITITIIARSLLKSVKNLVKPYKNVTILELASPKELIRQLTLCDVVFSIKGSNFLGNQVSGIIPLAISFLKPIVVPSGIFDMYKELQPESLYAYKFNDNICDIVNQASKASIDTLNNVRNIFSNHSNIALNEELFSNIKNSNGDLADINLNIHMIWLNTDIANDTVPQKYLNNINRWKNMHSKHTVTVWTNSMIRKLVADNFPTYLDGLYKLQPLIARCDIVRWMVLYVHGGLYIDMDYYCVRPITSLLKNKNHIFIPEAVEHTDVYGNLLLVGVMYVKNKQDVFVNAWVTSVMDNVKSKNYTLSVSKILDITGPIAFAKFYESNGNTLAPNAISELNLTCAFGSITKDHDISRMCISSQFEPFMYNMWSEGSSWDNIMNYNESTTGASLMHPVHDVDIDAIQPKKNLIPAILIPICIIIGIYASRKYYDDRNIFVIIVVSTILISVMLLAMI